MPNQTVTIAQALASNGTSLQVLDTAANIAGALPNASLVARCASFTLSAAATLGTAAADKLATLATKFHLGGEALTVVDTVANMIATANAAGLALATTRQIEDAAYNLLNAPSSAFTNITNVILTGAPVLSMAQLTKLESLPGFTVASGSHFVTADALSAYIPVLSAHPGYFAAATAVQVRLDGTQIGAAGVTALATLANAGKTVSFYAGVSDTTLNVTATAQDLATAAASLNQIGALIGLHFTVSNDGSAVTAAVATALISITGFLPSAHTLYISDTGAALTAHASSVFGHGFAQIVVTSGNFTGTAAELVDPTLHLNSGTTVTMAGIATVTAQQAAALDALPGFALATGASLTVSDTITNILHYASSLGIASAVTVTDSETVSAANASLLEQVAAAHPGHFSLAGHSVTVSDTATNLAALTPQTIALASFFTLSTSGMVTTAQFTTLRDTLHVALGGNTLTIDDTAAHLLALTGSLTLAAATTLSGPATVTAVQVMALSVLPSFSNGGFALTASDTAANIAAHEYAILHFATVGVVTDTGPVNTSQADSLALLSNVGKLAFQGGDHLIVNDSYANLIAVGNAGGVALANSLVVTDTAANLVTAAAHNWGVQTPSYVLSANAVITGAQATALAALGASFTASGHTLTVADNATNVLAASAALTSLNIGATVSDTSATLGSDSAALLALGTHLTAVQATDPEPVSAALAAGLAPLAGKLSGTVAVQDSAANIDTNLANLVALGSHAVITAVDTPANIGAHATDLATLGTELTVVLTGNAPVLAAVAAALDPVVSRLAHGTTVAVTDTAANIAGTSLALGLLGSALGTITLSGGNGVTAAQAASLLPLQSHLGLGVQLAVTDTAADIVAAEGALLSLHTDGRLASVTDSGDTAAAVAGAVTALNAVGASVTTSDTESNILAVVATLAQVTGLTAVTITDVFAPIFTLTIAAYVAEKAVLNLVTNSHTIAISDTAANIESDLASTSSVLTGITTPLTITPLGGAALVLPQAVALKPAVIAILPDLIGTLQVTGVDVAHLGAVQALSPTGVTIADTAANIQADLLSGSSALLADLAHISGITVLGGGTIALTAAEALTAHVDDGASSVFGLLSGATLSVVQASVAQVPSLLALHTPPAAISISDTAANITAALTNPLSPILTSAAAIVALHVSDGQPVILTEAQDMATGVNDGPHAALTKLSGAALDVTGVSVSQLPAVEDTAAVPTSIAITDTGSDISGGLPTLLADLSNLGLITISSGTVTFSATQALMPNVASGFDSLVSLLPGNSYTVSGATIAQIPQLRALAFPPASITVTDTSANLVADLLSGNSQWAAYIGGGVTVIGGTLTLTDAQADTINGQNLNVHFGALVPGSTVDITGGPVSDLVTLSGFHSNLSANGNTLHLEVADTALNLANDLAQAHPAETQEAAYINSITLTGAGGTLNAAQLTAVAGISGLITNGVQVTVQDTAAAIVGLSLSARALVNTTVVQDTTANVLSELGALQSAYGGGLIIHLTDLTPNLVVNAATYTADHATIEAIANTACVTVTGNAAEIAAIEPTLAADTHVAAVQVTDTGFNVVTNLAAISALGSTATVTLSDVGSISAAVASALVAANLAHINYGSLMVADTGAQIAAMAETGTAAQNFLVAHGAELTTTSNVALLDAQALHGLGNALNLNGQTVNVWDGAYHLTQPGAAASLASLVGAGLVTDIYLKTTAGTVTLPAVTAATLLAIPGLSIDNPDGSPNAITIADTAQHLATNYAVLDSNLGLIATILVTASATVSEQTLSDLQNLGATTTSGVALTLSDTATNILTAASAGPVSVQATSYALDASATITPSQALALAALSNFSPGSYTLTVGPGIVPPLSVSQANQLGALGSALVVLGPVFSITGSVSSLAGLTAAGAAVGHVTLADTLADIAALSPTSPLLSGTISVTDAEPLTASEATSFLTLLNSAGVASGNVSFNGHTETVTDSIAALRTLTSSTAWTGNTGLQSHFALVAEDTVANLTNSANTAFLHTLSGEELSATTTVSAATAESLATLPNFSVGLGNSLIVTDTAANLIATANAAGVAVATSVNLSAAATVNAAGAETLLQIPNFHLTQPLTIIDTSANLLDGTLAGLIAGHSQVAVSLAGPQTLDAQTATSLVALQGFSDTADMHIVDSSSYLLQSSATAAELMAASVSLAGNETVSAATVLRLAETPHFTYSGGTLSLASNDFANAQTLQAVADMGTNFSENGHSLTLTQNNLSLAPVELAAIIADGGVTLNGYVISAMPVNATYTDTGNLLSVSAAGVAGATVNVYGGTGTLLSSTPETNASFTVTAPDVGTGNSFSITETVNGVESAPVVVLDQTTLEHLVTLAPTSFASSGQIQIDSGKYINLYTAGAVLPNAPSLVYDPVAHTVSLDMPNAAPVTLITLGASTAPASLQSTEILIKHHS